MKVVAILGHKKSGKTRLATMLIRSLRERGYTVASAKHVHHADFSIDQYGKDSWKHSEAGANPNIIISPNEIAVIWKKKFLVSPQELKDLVGHVDFLILEGFYSLVKHYTEVLKIFLVKNEEDLANLEGIIFATFEELNNPDIIKLPEQYPQLLKIILEK
ncbi:MAG: molybdopterin-guanine dinucleotide biosynthesis protein B [Nitrososphaeria archaeon]|nr:molybdopterin-guanine dinucleotide biosynthesis protein B [Nitrososphaeria archaeon]MDW7986572.1 molybdopterin-guanine dinucleotide biosynthesis protein B [Nitrososphaerota archaeon]